jgi:hypothetical protein
MSTFLIRKYNNVAGCGEGEAGRTSTTYLTVCSLSFRNIYGPKGKEVTGGWRKLSNDYLHYLYSSKVAPVMIVFRLRYRKLVVHAVYFGEEKCIRSFLGGGVGGRRKETTRKTYA